MYTGKQLKKMVCRTIFIPGKRTGYKTLENQGRYALQTKMSEVMLQLKKVSDDHVATDLLHDEAAKLFTRASYRFFNENMIETEDFIAKSPAARRRKLTEYVGENRSNVDYEQLRDSTLQNNKQLMNWLDKDAAEHMYVHSGNTINIAMRNTEKLPHPTLVGGDPDAKCAGTMYAQGKIVYVTNASGHFRPGKVAEDTIKYVAGIHKKKGEQVVKCPV